MLRLLSAVLFAGLISSPAFSADPPKLSILFLGDNAGHKPKERFDILKPVLEKKGIALSYTDSLDDINLANLNKYDGLMIYANQTPGKPEHVKAIIDYVEAGKGFIPLHCASFCFTRSEEYIALVGGQFRSHQTGTFRVNTIAAEHPIMKGYGGFESWDETYVHTKHNENGRTVLEVRDEKDLKEPWTWVRTQGKGRVFYTAWGHDARTWNQPGFHNLVERGTRWACGQDPAIAGEFKDAGAPKPITIPKMTPVKGDKTDFEYVDAKLPFYVPPKAAGIASEAPTKMQKPLPPEKSVTHASVPEGFELKLFASDEQFQGGKPLAMNWDERGRLWVSVTTDYPNELQKEGQGRDKILILEDTDGDGKADKVTTFADALSIPTSLLCAWGGAIVHQAPHTLFLKDTDGDGKADVRQVLFSGWGTGDTHAGPSNLRYGFDNWIYGAVGYSGFVGDVAGESLRFRQGFYRFKVEPSKLGEKAPLKVTKLEFLRSTSNNTWGFCFNEQGEMFGSTANGCALVHLPIPNRYYEKVPGLSAGVLPPINDSNRMYPITEKVRQVDWHGGFTAASHCAIYTARTYPEDYWNRVAFVSEPTGHLTATFVLQEKGTDYTAKYGWNLIASQDEWTAPIDAQVGPDGNMWILDWYNYIVQHNPTPKGFSTGKGNAYETNLRDKKHGRIYRLVYKDPNFKIPFAVPNLKDATPAQLVETLKNDNMFWRQTAQRLLVEAPSHETQKLLAAVLADAKADPFQVQHALYTLAGLKVAAAEANLLVHPSPVVRRAAVSLLPNDPASIVEIVKANLHEDADSGVRLAAWLKVSEIPSSGVATAASPLVQPMAGLSPSVDKNLSAAMQMAWAAHAETVLAAATTVKGSWSREGLAALERVASSYASKAPPGVGTVVKSFNDTPAGLAVLAGIAGGWPTGKAANLSADDEKNFSAALAAVPAVQRGKLLKLGTTWGVKGLDAQLAEIVKGSLATALDAKAADADRIEAARQVLEYQPDAAAKLLETITEKSSAALSLGMIELLAPKNVGGALVDKLPLLPPTARPVALRAILSRAEAVVAFLDSVEKGTLRFDMLDLDQKQALAAHPNKAVAERAKKLLAQGGGLPNADRQKVIEEFAATAKAKGDAANGKKLFAQHCAKCHKHGGEGNQIGPDLTGFGVHPKEEILIAVLDPSRSVEGNFKAYTANTLDGRLIVGLLSSESKTAVELLDAENKRHALNRDDIDSLKESTKSLMPEGFEKQMKPQEFGDLLEFLAQKGKYVPIPLDKAATVVSTKDMFFGGSGEAERIVFKDWAPKTFKGVPFHLVDPQGEKVKNVVMLHGPQGVIPPSMPKSVSLPCNTPAKAIHLLSGIGGWNASTARNGQVCMIVKLTYADGKTEEHPLKDGVHFADYIRRADVPGSEFAFAVRGQQVRFLSVTPKRSDSIITIELVKGPDRSAPIVVAVTVETP
jgi:putative membrane-bound dehydrogenase-like protein